MAGGPWNVSAGRVPLSALQGRLTETERNVAEEPLTVVQGTLELLVLKTLAAAGDAHGFAILDFIRRATNELLVVEEGALYPALHRMEARGWLASDWGVSEKGRRAKYYRLTRSGRQALAREQERWTAYVDAVSRLVPESAGGPPAGAALPVPTRGAAARQGK
jgi:transcriptional regulator